MKIFITGFQRSGTTLLKDLFGHHPDIKHMFHEQCVLKHFPSKKSISKIKQIPDSIPTNKKNRKGNYRRSAKIQIDFSLLKDSWGEKVPYYSLFFKKGFHVSFQHYCKLWNQYFLPDCRIVHIVRHPFDVGISTKNRGYSRSVGKPIKRYNVAVPQVINFLDQFPNVIHVKYEDLVLNPEKTLKNLFKRCGLQFDETVIDKVIESNVYWFGYINPDRAFNYKKEKIARKKHNIAETIRFINKRVGGVKYDI